MIRHVNRALLVLFPVALGVLVVGMLAAGAVSLLGSPPSGQEGTSSDTRRLQTSHSEAPATTAGASSASGPSKPAEPTSGPAQTTPTQKEKTEDSSDPRRKAALRFASAYTRTDRPKKGWMGDIRRLSTAHLAQGLSYTDLAVVPSSSPTANVEVAARSEVHITMRVPLQSGQVLLVTLKPGGCPGGWCADRLVPGDAGGDVS